MKTAIIMYKEYGTNNIINEGEAILLNCMDRQINRGFWETRLLKDQSTTHCYWIDNSEIMEQPEEVEQ